MKNKIAELIRLQYEKSLTMPEISHFIALSLDRALSQLNSPLITFSKNGISPNSIASLTDSSLIISKTSKNNNIIKKIDNQNIHLNEKTKLLFEMAQGNEIDCLNLFYANHFLKYPLVWLHFFNKYLVSRGGRKIDLNDTISDNIFNRFTADNSKRIESAKLVSVLMPAYNCENTIYYAAKSILNQTYRNLELIIIDDCSSDNTSKICEQLLKEDKRVKYIRNKVNSGAYVSRNNGLLIAEGDYITVNDSDDWSVPWRIEYQLKKLENSKTANAHLGYYMRISASGEIVNYRLTGDFSFDGCLHKCLATLLIKREFFDKYLGYWDSVKVSADSEMYNRILTIDKDAIIEDFVPIYLAYSGSDNLTNSKTMGLGSDLRAKYAESFLNFHENSELYQLKYKYCHFNRPFDVPDDINIKIPKKFDISYLERKTYYSMKNIKDVVTSRLERFDFINDGTVYQSLWEENYGDYLFVFFHGAQDRKKSKPPYFERHSWYDVFPGSMLLISDPTLLLDSSLRIGWYVGNNSFDPIRSIVEMVKIISNAKNIPNSKIVFYGSSGAGFAALSASRYIQDSVAIAINTQTDIRKYYATHVSDLYNVCFGGLNEEQIAAHYAERLDMVSYYGQQEYKNRVVLIQNILDKFHYNNHYLPFIRACDVSEKEGRSANGLIRTMLYKDEKGHGPESKDMVPEILSML